MATKQGWMDFKVIVSRIEQCIDEIDTLFTEINRLEKDKADIVDDADRLADVKEILDIHPDYSVNWFTTRFNKLKMLKQYLEDNGYL